MTKKTKVEKLNLKKPVTYPAGGTASDAFYGFGSDGVVLAKALLDMIKDRPSGIMLEVSYSAEFGEPYSGRLYVDW